MELVEIHELVEMVDSAVLGISAVLVESVPFELLEVLFLWED